MKIICEDCKCELHPECNHIGFPRWCEECFEKGLAKDMDEHARNFFKVELSERKEGL
jgi:hypothetical protein